MAFTQEVMNYDSLLAGPTQVIATVPLAASQTVKRGDLLVAAVTIAAGASTSTIAASFSKAAAAAAPGLSPEQAKKAQAEAAAAKAFNAIDPNKK